MNMKGMLKDIIVIGAWLLLSTSSMKVCAMEENADIVKKTYIENIEMYEDELLILYNQYLEQLSEPMVNSSEYSTMVLDGFAQYAVERGVIEDTIEQKGEITKAVVRAEFRLIVSGGKLIGFTTASELLEHSLQDNPTNLNYNTLSDKAIQISKSTECQTIVNQFKADAEANNLDKMTMSGSIALTSAKDLHLAYHNVNYTMTGVKNNGKWTGSIVFTDTYDFDAVTWKDALTDNLLVGIINNYAAYAESIGAIVPYNIQVTVPVVF